MLFYIVSSSDKKARDDAYLIPTENPDKVVAVEIKGNFKPDPLNRKHELTYQS